LDRSTVRRTYRGQQDAGIDPSFKKVLIGLEQLRFLKKMEPNFGLKGNSIMRIPKLVPFALVAISSLPAAIAPLSARRHRSVSSR
jgi:hypothetical protein